MKMAAMARRRAGVGGLVVSRSRSARVVDVYIACCCCARTATAWRIDVVVDVVDASLSAGSTRLYGGVAAGSPATAAAVTPPRRPILLFNGSGLLGIRCSLLYMLSFLNINVILSIVVEHC